MTNSKKPSALVILICTQNHCTDSSSHRLHIVTFDKVSPNVFDDEQYILDNGINTLPFGHINIDHDRFSDEDDSSNNESFSSWSSGEIEEIKNRREIESIVETNNNHHNNKTFAIRTIANREPDIDSDQKTNENDI